MIQMEHINVYFYLVEKIAFIKQSKENEKHTYSKTELKEKYLYDKNILLLII